MLYLIKTIYSLNAIHSSSIAYFLMSEEIKIIQRFDSYYSFTSIDTSCNLWKETVYNVDKETKGRLLTYFILQNTSMCNLSYRDF